MNREEIGLKLIDLLYDKGIDKEIAKGILVFSKTPENWSIIIQELEERPEEYDENRLQLFALALGFDQGQKTEPCKTKAFNELNGLI